MRTGSLWMRAGLGMALLLSINVARAQGPESLPPPANGRQMAVPPPSSIPYSVDQPMHQEEHEAHEEHHAEGGECNHEEERGLFVIADFLYVRPRRRALDFVINDPFAKVDFLFGLVNAGKASSETVKQAMLGTAQQLVGVGGGGGAGLSVSSVRFL